MKDFSVTRYFRSFSIILIITSLLPILDNNLPPIIGSYRFLWAPIWLLSIALFYPKIFLNKQVIYFMLYGIIFIQLFLNILWKDMLDWDKLMVKEEYYIFAVSLSVIFYFRISKDYRGLAILVKWSMIFIGLTAIMTIYSSILDPMYARNMIGGVYSKTQLEYFLRLGGGNYSYAGALIGIFPILIYYYRNSRISIFERKYIMAFGIICLIALIRMQIFANILMALISIIISLLGSKKVTKSIIFICIFFLIILLMPSSLYSKALINISHYFNSKSDIYFKLTDMSNFIVNNNVEETAAGIRVARYPLLLKGFLTNPFLGYYFTPNKVDIGAGAHLYWMNKLTIFGLFGFIPFVLIHLFFIKSNLKYFNKEYSFYYLISSFSILSLGLMKNLAGREMWFFYFVVFPGLYYLPLLRRQKSSINSRKQDAQVFSNEIKYSN
jgi:hypothetical protein